MNRIHGPSQSYENSFQIVATVFLYLVPVHAHMIDEELSLFFQAFEIVPERGKVRD